MTAVAHGQQIRRAKHPLIDKVVVPLNRDEVIAAGPIDGVRANKEKYSRDKDAVHDRSKSVFMLRILEHSWRV